jgi:hypothetical protein
MKRNVSTCFVAQCIWFAGGKRGEARSYRSDVMLRG